MEFSGSLLADLSWTTCALLALALLLALGFEFVNGFHDTANAVATVIYTHSLPATPAVACSPLLAPWPLAWSPCCRWNW